MKYLVFDISNVLHRAFYANKNEDDDTIAGMAAHVAMMTTHKYFKLHKPDKVIMCFDRQNWRKGYTQSEKCISGKLYKGNRRVDLTEKEKEKYENFRAHVNEFEELIREHTSIQVLAGDGLEADDLMAMVTEYYTLIDEDAYSNEIVIISSDKDLLQLLRYPRVTLQDPATDKNRNLVEWNNDPDYFLFEKCIRGDRGDNVQSAYPRIRKTKILEAYNDPLKYENLMHHEWTAPGLEEKTFKVKDLFKENQLLMDLSKQPEHYRKRMIKIVLEGKKHPGTFSYFHFMRFLGKYNLERLSQSADQFVKMLSC